MSYFSDVNWLWTEWLGEDGERVRATKEFLTEYYPSNNSTKKYNMHDIVTRGRFIIKQNWTEAALLWKYSKLTKGNIVEIGRFHGGSTVLLIEATRDTDRKVISIDPEDAYINKKCREVFNEAGDRLQLINEYSENVVMQSNYELLFIDANHRYPHIKNDTVRFWDNLEMNGYVLYHDYSNIATADVTHFCDAWETAGKMVMVEQVRSMIAFQKVEN